MGLFWTSFFAHLKGCGRNATLFMIALAGVFILLLLCAGEFFRFLRPALPWLGLLAAAWAGFSLRRTLARRRDRLQRQPLSDHELRLARSKLLKSRR